MRPIDADALLEALNAHEYLGESEYFTGAKDAHDSIVEAIRLMPILDLAPVIRAHRIDKGDLFKIGGTVLECSNCGSHESVDINYSSPYCRMCGAKMDDAD